MQDRFEQVKVYIGGELKGPAEFRGTLSRATLTLLDSTAFIPTGGGIVVEFSDGEMWEFQRPHGTISSRSGLPSSNPRIELIEGRVINSQKDE